MIKTIKNAFSPAIILALLAIPSCVIYAIDHPLRLEHLWHGFSRMIEQSSPIDCGGMSAHLPALLGACLIVLAGFSVGVIARAAASGMTNKPGLKDGREPAPWSTAFTILAGWGVLILIIAAAGFVGWLNPAFLTLLLMLSLLPLPWMVWTWVRGRAGDQVPSQRPWAIIAALSLLAAWVLLPAIVNVLAPPHEPIAKS